MPAVGSRGGPQLCEPPFVEALRSLGHFVDEETYVFGEGDAQISSAARVRRVVDAARRMRAKVSRSAYDVVHLNTSIDERCIIRDLLTLRSLRSSGVPVFLKMHGSIASFLAARDPIRNRLKLKLFDRAAGIGVLSGEELENFAAAGCPRDRLYVVRNAYRSDGAPADADFRQEIGAADDETLLLFSSRFVQGKGLMDVIDAVARLAEQGIRFRLYCLGDGPERAAAEQRVERHGLADLVRFTGYVSEAEASRYHANTDIFLLPTYHDEGFPVVIMKALDAGQAIVTTKTRGAGEWLVQDENCLFVPPKDPAAVAEAIVQLCRERATREAMAENNRRLCHEFGPEVVAAEYVEIYRKISA